MRVATLRLLGLAAMFLAAIASAQPASAQTFGQAFAAYERGDYATAYRGFRRLAEQGGAVAQHNLGVMYENGQGVSRNYANAVRWYRRAAEQGIAESKSNLGTMYAKAGEFRGTAPKPSGGSAAPRNRDLPWLKPNSGPCTS